VVASCLAAAGVEQGIVIPPRTGRAEPRPTTIELTAPRRGTLIPVYGRVGALHGIEAPFHAVARHDTHVHAEVIRVSGETATAAVVATASAPVYRDDTVARVRDRIDELAQSLTTLVLLDRIPETTRSIPLDAIPDRQGNAGSPRASQRLALSTRIAVRRASARLRSVPYVAKTMLAIFFLAVARRLRGAARTLLRRHPVRIFTFHRISNLCRDGMTVSPSVFERQIIEIERHHDIVSLDRAIKLAADGTRLRRPVAALTFDDAYRSVMTYAYPIMTRAGVTGTCFVATGFVNTEGRFPHDAGNPVREHLSVMSWRNLRTLAGAGWLIGGHTVSHPRLAACDAGTIDAELSTSFASLREQTGVSAPPFAFPFGGEHDITPYARRRVEELGYAACLADFGGEIARATNPFALTRIELGGDHSELAWRTRVHGFDRAEWRHRIPALHQRVAVRAS
jgi:peptidoglycan/xylan/chitin deacetylase (PgdA/CDA1 family)